jgi:hypothetical protein
VEREHPARNAMSDESLYCSSDFGFDRDMCDPTHLHCHRKSEIYDDLPSLAGSSASTIDGIYGQQAHRESCIEEWRLQNHRKLVGASMADAQY